MSLVEVIELSEPPRIKLNLGLDVVVTTESMCRWLSLTHLDQGKPLTALYHYSTPTPQ